MTAFCLLTVPALVNPNQAPSCHCLTEVRWRLIAVPAEETALLKSVCSNTRCDTS